MKINSAGLLLYRQRSGITEVMLVHPGGPFWKKKDHGAWSIPKGEFGAEEDPLEAARRELTEETGFVAKGNFIPLGKVRQKSGKWVQAWAVRQDVDTEKMVSNHFEMEWPPRSGKMQSFPEVDKAAWFDLAEARTRINPAQAQFIDLLETWINRS